MKFKELLSENTSGDIAGGRPAMGEMRRRLDHRSGDLSWQRDIKANTNSHPAVKTPEEIARAKALALKAKQLAARRNSPLGRFKDYIARNKARFTISESFELNDVLSRLASLETDSATNNVVSFGIEDDQGNMMKVTVKKEQSEDFEAAIAEELATAAQRKEVTGENVDISLPELLVKLNDRFEIVDVEFPTIPRDAVYNADKVQYGMPDSNEEDVPSMDDDGLGGEGGLDGDPGLEGGMDAGLGGDAPMGGEGGLEGDMGGEGNPLQDDGSVEDFPEELPPSDSSPESLLQSVLSMLKAEAETRKAEADARAEEARMKQAEYSAMAAKNSVAQQEEVLRMEAEIEDRKRQEKEAKRIADIAKYRVSKTASAFGESMNANSFSSYVTRIVEFEEFDTPASVAKQRSLLRMKYAPSPDDDELTARFKRESWINASRELDAKLRQANATQRYKAERARLDAAKGKEQEPTTPNQTPQQNQQSNQPQQGNTQPQGNIQ